MAGGGDKFLYDYDVIYSGASTETLLQLSWTSAVLSTKLYSGVYTSPQNILVQSVYGELWPSGVSDGYTMYNPTVGSEYWDHQKLTATDGERDYVMRRFNTCYSGMGTWSDAGPGSIMTITGLTEYLPYQDSLEER